MSLLSKLTKVELINKCKELSIRGYSNKTKDAIIKLIEGVDDIKQEPDMNITKSTFTITFGDQAENHAGMQKIGNLVKEGEGFNLSDLNEIKNKFEMKGVTCILYNLINESGLSLADNLEAYVLVIKGGLNKLGLSANDMFNEQASIEHDKKAYMYGRVVDKKARWNVCFGENPQEPAYEEKKGRIIEFNKVPLLLDFIKKMPEMFGSKAVGMYGEGNYYYDISKCGIGFHGDSERRKVIAVRLGASLPIHYQWYKNSEALGNRIIVPLEHGDIYVMSEKAVGTDWKKKSIYTLRHATGCTTFTKQ